jgi:Beta/Gamma crystallin
MTSRHSRCIVASALALAVTSAFAGQITLYERPDFQGSYVVANDGIAVVQGQGFGNTAASIVVVDGTWEVCTGANFDGRCAQLVPGNYPGIDVRLNGRIASVRQVGYADRSSPVAIVTQPYVTQPYAIPVAPVVNPPLVGGRAVLFEDPNFAGAWVPLDRGVANDLDWAHFTNPLHRATSIRVESGTFLFCTDMAFQGECRVLGPGEYPQLPGPLVTGISSARQVGYPELGARDVYRR